MELVSPSEDPKRHKWLAWTGIEPPALQADSWVPVMRGFPISDHNAGTSNLGARLVDLLGKAGIEAGQRPYEISVRATGGSLTGITSLGGRMGTMVAVLVHNRDRARASEVAAQFMSDLKGDSDPLRDERRAQREAELEREALEAGSPPDV